VSVGGTLLHAQARNQRCRRHRGGRVRRPRIRCGLWSQRTSCWRCVAWAQARGSGSGRRGSR